MNYILPKGTLIKRWRNVTMQGYVTTLAMWEEFVTTRVARYTEKDLYHINHLTNEHTFLLPKMAAPYLHVKVSRSKLIVTAD